MNSSTKRKLERFAKFIETLPRKAFGMNEWVNIPYSSEVKSVNKQTAFDCGTKCCLAGWEGIRRNKELTDNGTIVNRKPGEKRHVEDFARESLGLTIEESFKLFLPGSWPYNNLSGREMFNETPKGAAKRIRYFIKTGE